MPGRIWLCELSSFAGISIGASHTRATLKAGTRRHNVCYFLTPKDARRLSEQDEHTWDPGDWAERFFTRDEAIAAAKVAFTAVAQEGDILLRGFIGDCGPQEVLVGPDDLAAIWVEAEATCVSPLDAHPIEYEVRWRACIDKYGLARPDINDDLGLDFDTHAQILLVRDGDSWKVEHPCRQPRKSTAEMEELL